MFGIGDNQTVRLLMESLNRVHCLCFVSNSFEEEMELLMEDDESWKICNGLLFAV